MYRVFIKYCVFSKILIYFPDSVFSRCQCVYIRQAGRTPALQQNWQSSEKSQHFKEKTQYLMNTLYHVSLSASFILILETEHPCARAMETGKPPAAAVVVAAAHKMAATAAAGASTSDLRYIHVRKKGRHPSNWLMPAAGNKNRCELEKKKIIP